MRLLDWDEIAIELGVGRQQRYLWTKDRVVIAAVINAMKQPAAPWRIVVGDSPDTVSHAQRADGQRLAVYVHRGTKRDGSKLYEPHGAFIATFDDSALARRVALLDAPHRRGEVRLDGRRADPAGLLHLCRVSC